MFHFLSSLNLPLLFLLLFQFSSKLKSLIALPSVINTCFPKLFFFLFLLNSQISSHSFMTLSSSLLENVGGLDRNNLSTIIQHLGISDELEHSYPTSEYLDIDAFISQMPKTESIFSIFTLNIECLSAKFDKICALLQVLSDSNIYFSAIAIQETWLPENFDYSLYTIPGYNAIHHGYTCGKKGGLITYVNERFTISKRDLYKTSNHWEGLIIDIMHDDLPKKITLANIYRPPRDNNSNKSVQYFLEPMSTLIETISNENSLFFCCGDFNLDLLKLEQRSIFQEYFDMFVLKGIIPLITLPTRFSKKNATLIDQIFCKYSGISKDMHSGILVTKISDHLPCFTYIDLIKRKHKQPKYVKIRVNTEQALDDFRNDLSESLLSENFANDLTQDPNISYDMLNSIIHSSKEKFLPIRIVKFKKYKHKISPWMTKGILKSMKAKDKLYKKLKKTNPEAHDYPLLEHNFKTYCSMTQKCIRLAKSSYYHTQFERYKLDIKNLEPNK